MSHKLLLCLRELVLGSSLSNTISCISLQNAPWIQPLFTASTAAVPAQHTTLSCLEESNSLPPDRSPSFSLAPLQSILHPTGQVILDKCQSNHVTSCLKLSRGFSLYPNSLSCFIRPCTICFCLLSNYILCHFPHRCASATLSFFLFLELIKLIISPVTLHLLSQLFPRLAPRHSVFNIAM